MTPRLTRALTKLKQRDYATDDKDFVFVSELTLDRPVPERPLRKAFKVAGQNAGLKPIKMYNLRHSFGTTLASRGVDVRTIQALMALPRPYLSVVGCPEGVARFYLGRIWSASCAPFSGPSLLLDVQRQRRRPFGRVTSPMAIRGDKQKIAHKLSTPAHASQMMRCRPPFRRKFLRPHLPSAYRPRQSAPAPPAPRRVKQPQMTLTKYH